MGTRLSEKRRDIYSLTKKTGKSHFGNFGIQKQSKAGNKQRQNNYAYKNQSRIKPFRTDY